MKYSEATEACNPHLQGSKNLEFQLALRTSISQNCPCPGQVLVCSFNDFKFKADNVPKFLCPLSKSEWKLNKGTCTCTCPEERSTCPGWPDDTFLSTSLINGSTPRQCTRIFNVFSNRLFAGSKCAGQWLTQFSNDTQNSLEPATCTW